MKTIGSPTMDMRITLLEAVLSLNILFFALAEGKLLTVPQNTTVVEGEKIRLECKTDLEVPVFWYHDGKGIFTGGAVSLIYQQTYKVTTDNPGEYNLVIDSATQKHNGVYKCKDNEGAGEEQSAYVTVKEPTVVLYSTPTSGNSAPMAVIVTVVLVVIIDIAVATM